MVWIAKIRKINHYLIQIQVKRPWLNAFKIESWLLSVKALTPLHLQHQNTYFPKWGHYLFPEGWSSVGCYILQPTSHRISSHLFVLQNYKWDKSFVLTSLGPVQLLPSQPLAPPSFKLAQHNAQSYVGFLLARNIQRDFIR